SNDGTDVTSSATYQWQHLVNGTWSTIATGSSFTPTDDGEKIRVVISFTEPESEGGGVDTITRYLGTVAEPKPTLTATETYADQFGVTHSNANFVAIEHQNPEVTLNLATSFADPGATLSTLKISNVPTGATISDGHDHSFTATSSHHSVDVHNWTL